MNDRPSGPERAEHEEMARLLPAPAERDLPPGRHLHHKDTLMRLIDQDGDRATERTRSRLLRPAVLLPAAGLALGGVLLTTLAVTGQDSAPAPSAAGTGSRTTAAHGAAVLLDRIALAAGRSGGRTVTGDQFVYVRTLGTGNEGEFGGPVKLTEPGEREVWMSQKAGPVVDVGLIHEDDAYVPIVVGVPDGETPVGYPAGLNRPTYAWLASLPTDPDVLLRRLTTEITRDQDSRDTPAEDRDEAQDAFDAIGELLRETVMPPKTAAALYRAASRIPGVTVDPDAVDAAGRHGIGVARDDVRAGWRTAWIFDSATLEYLGERTCLSRDTSMGRKGTLIGASAVLERAVVDALRERPSTTT
ncbi:MULTISPECIES: CU044_5270 family protein [Streptomyces]|uniref:CU044_5270 family protein n=1 Tax=Streptomyces glycanivorans TaxID=3033808 RepID=A0ABY9JH06_9ACTN|nr:MULTISPECIES: CU044_5270 family protein [unclassified Streptomyces]WSQ80329.1 CU044_5270 family protein [Streptomyces sp. NBC_01213]WLQ66908.1 CU044_5270 family protein [Streptomyces sp. Alt3]WSQ87660.1 CU044_5270 family protein [Streptomyces sp. NBC_01212]WSR06330.1 CU044_5270 family protein [Streptomyces sp. NBC_01208]WSR51063.1 CU044_5270 family protein [Streptomyces sp. NBC_01201]